MVIVGLLTTLAKKLVKDKVKKLGTAMYNQTLKPILEKLKAKAKDYMTKLVRKPLDQKTQRELDKIMKDIDTVETERANLPGPEIELPPQPPKRGNRLPVLEPEEPHGDMFGGFGIGDEPDFSTGLYAVDLEEELAPFNPEYAKGVSKADQIIHSIEEQEAYVYGDMMEHMVNNMPLKSDDAVAIRHEVEMTEFPKKKPTSVWMGDDAERKLFRESREAVGGLDYGPMQGPDLVGVSFLEDSHARDQHLMDEDAKLENDFQDYKRQMFSEYDMEDRTPTLVREVVDPDQPTLVRRSVNLDALRRSRSETIGALHGPGRGRLRWLQRRGAR